MSKLRILALGTVAAIAMAPTTGAFAIDTANFTSHHLVEKKSYENYVEKLPAERKLEVREYLDYETLEPCQFYQPIPDGFVKEGCDIIRIEPKKVVAPAPAPAPQPAPRPAPVTYNKVIQDYEVNFAFDSSNLSGDANSTLDTVAQEIRTYNPAEVTVQGHTDTSGPADYNVKLSQRRAMAVSNALTSRGVSNRVIDAKAYGENGLAVPTDDGVKLRENRRVVIEFLK